MQTNLEKANWAVGLMQQRQSVRAFTTQPIPPDILHTILAAGINAATGGNLQPYSIIVEQDQNNNNRLCEICGDQQFIAQAAVNLVFLLDWHKLAGYAHANGAPFTCNKSFRHYSIAVDDLVCAAQSIEIAAWLFGIGSCYVGTILDSIPECVELYKLPKMVAPLLILSLGYPKGLTARRKKLAFDMVVFNGAYPRFSQEELCAAYDKKYEGMRTPLPQDPERRQDMLSEFRRALLTTYDQEKCEQILQATQAAGYIVEVQRRFGLHYHAADMLTPEVTQALATQDIYPFYGLSQPSSSKNA